MAGSVFDPSKPFTTESVTPSVAKKGTYNWRELEAGNPIPMDRVPDQETQDRYKAQRQTFLNSREGKRTEGDFWDRLKENYRRNIDGMGGYYDTGSDAPGGIVGALSGQVGNAGMAALSALDAVPRTILGDEVVDDPVLQALSVEPGLVASVGKFKAPKNDPLSAEARALSNQHFNDLFSKGATYDELQLEAKKAGMSAFPEDELRNALKLRDEKQASAVKTPAEEVPVAEPVKAQPEVFHSPETLTDGSVRYSYTHPTSGENIPVRVGWDGPVATVDVNTFGASKNQLGPVDLRNALFDFINQFPEATEVGGFRRSGAGAGREQVIQITPKLREQAAAYAEKQNPVIKSEPSLTQVDNLNAPPQFEGDVVQRLTAAINNAGKLSQEQAALLSQSRSEKLQDVLKARATSSGEAGLSSEMAQLRGEAPKVDYEGVRGQFTQDEIDGLFDSIKQNPSLSLFDSINARMGLAKLLDGTVPTRSEVNLLSKVFPADFVKAAMRHRSTSAKIADFAGNALNLPRSLMSTLDLSAPLRQGVFLSGRREFYNAFGSMFKQFGSERVYRGVMDDIKARDTYPLMEESKLSLSDMGHDLSQREEAFMSQWAERIPGVGRVVRASERGFSGFLNKLRADTFDDLVRRSVAAGVDFKANPKALSDIASFVNAATGRGSLGKLNSSAPLLNGLFFSPRLIASRVQMLNPAYYATLSPVVRKEAVKSLLTFGTLATSVLTLAHMGGADVEVDPRSSDFGKIKIGNTRYDILGGFGQYVTLGARLATNETKTLKGEVQTLGERYGSRTRLDTAGNFLANKASPVAGYVRDYLRGADPVGNPFDARKDAAQLFIPLFLQDAYSVMQDGGVEALPRVAPGFFGVGVQTYSEKSKFDHKQPFTEEVSAEAAPSPPETEAKFDPNQPFSVAEEGSSKNEDSSFDPSKPFETTTEGNLQVANILQNMGLHITDEGVRSEADQAKYYNTTNGAAAPGHSPHQSGNAIDIRVPKGVKPSDLVAELTAQGFKGVSIITKRHGTGPHWHIQWKGPEA